jgi:flagellar basal-body rod modification protein FlgD
MSTQPVTGTNGSTLSTSGSTISSASNAGLGQNQFLMLMMDQLKAQDPMQPSDPSQYLSELANFSNLEQSQQIAGSTSASAAQTQATSALTLLGHTVTYRDATGASQSGTVGKVDFTSSGPTLTIGTTSGIPLSSVTEAA